MVNRRKSAGGKPNTSVVNGLQDSSPDNDVHYPNVRHSQRLNRRNDFSEKRDVSKDNPSSRNHSQVPNGVDGSGSSPGKNLNGQHKTVRLTLFFCEFTEPVSLQFFCKRKDRFHFLDVVKGKLDDCFFSIE